MGWVRGDYAERAAKERAFLLQAWEEKAPGVFWECKEAMLPG